MSNEKIIEQLRITEAFAEGLRKECIRTIKLLEGVNPPAPSGELIKQRAIEAEMRFAARRKIKNAKS